MLLLFCGSVIYIWHEFYPNNARDIWVEAWGLAFDILFILILFEWFKDRSQRRQDEKFQRDIIDDYKRWDSPEAYFRIAGAIRRLNRIGIHAIDFSGARFTKFSFAQNGISCIDNSTFYDGVWGEPVGDHSVVLTEVSFDNISSKSVCYSQNDFFQTLGTTVFRHCQLIDCSFRSAALQDSCFRGALLKWSQEPPESLYEVEGCNEDGSPFVVQEHYPPFDRADLSGVSFEYAVLENADFRNADGILEANFTGAYGLESCEFDDDVKDIILQRFQAESSTE